MASGAVGGGSGATGARGVDGLDGGMPGASLRLEAGVGDTFTADPTSTPLAPSIGLEVGVDGTIIGSSVSSVSLKSGFLGPLSRL